MIGLGLLTVGLFSNRDAYIEVNPIGIHDASHFVMPRRREAKRNVEARSHIKQTRRTVVMLHTGHEPQNGAAAAKRPVGPRL